MEFLTVLRAQLKARLDERTAKADELESLLSVPAAEQRSDLTDVESAAFAELRSEIVAADEDIAELRARITEGEAMEAANTEARSLADNLDGVVVEPRVSIKSEELTYRQGGEHSYFRDLTLANAPGRFDSEARARLQRHADEMAVELRTTPNRTDGQMGEFVPPAWMLAAYVKLARAGRVTADLATKLELPAGTDSINIPKISTGSSVAAQTDNGSVSNTDITTETITAPVNTYAGAQSLSIQLLEQSPMAGGLDQVIFADLLADHAQKIGAAVVGGSGSAGAHTGILTNTGTTSITYTATTPDGKGMYAAIAQGISNVAKSRFLPADAVIMNPSRWYWLVSQVDGNGRPLVVPTAQAWNPVGNLDENRAEGSVGTIAGVNVYLDSNIGSTYSTNQDRIIIGRLSDAVLFEGPIKSRVLFETSAATLTVLLQVWNYSAFSSYRYSKSFAVVSGTGCVAPSGY